MPNITYITSEWDEEVMLGEQVLKVLKDAKAKTVALFASVQFIKLDTVKKQLKKAGLEVKTTKAKRTSAETQILGCDAYLDSYDKDILTESDALLYIGDGMFHPKALLLAQANSGNNTSIKPVLIWDPVNQRMKTITKEDILAVMGKKKANLTKYLSSDSIGIIVTTKPGQQYLKYAKLLKEKLVKQGKKAYIFLSDTIDYGHLENYPFIEAWVNTACPRIGMDDITVMQKPLINLREALDPENAIGRMV